DLGDHRVHAGRVGHVGRPRLGLTAGGGNLPGHGGGPGGVEVEHGDPGTLPAHGQRDRAPHAPRAPRDDRDLAREPHARTALAMMSRMISLVPPPMVISRASRAKRSTANSRM